MLEVPPEHVGHSEQRTEALMALNATILERIVLGTPLSTTLDALTLGIEELSDGMLASVLLLDREGVRLCHGSAPSLPDRYNQAIDGIEIGDGVGSCGTAAFTGEPVVVEDVLTHPYWIEFRDLASEHDLRACWSTPIRSGDGDVVGTFALYYREPRAPTEWHRTLIEAATRLARTAIEHDRARRELADSEERFRVVATQAPVGIFQCDLEMRNVFANPHLAEIVGRSVEELQANWPSQVHPDDAGVVGDRIKRAFRELVRWRSEHRIVRPGGQVRWVEVNAEPVRGADGQVSGFIGTYADLTERKEAEERQREFEREHLIAQTLQESLLLTQLPEVPGVQAAARYIAGEDGLRVGGDWYDVFALPGGRLGVAVGDVVGRGLEAATTMGQLRSALRALAWTTASPARVIEKLSQLAESDERMATLIYGIVDPSTRTLHYASAGHPPALLAAPDGSSLYLEDGRNPPLGIRGAKSEEAVVELEPGTVLMLYTDGLVERRDQSIDDGLTRLQEAVDPRAESLDALCASVVAGLGADEVGDDVAFVALRVEPAGSDSLRLSLPNEPKLLRAFRATLQRWLEAAGATERESIEIVLAASEAVGNAMTHAYSLNEQLLDVEADCDGGTVAITVRDHGQWRVLRREQGGRGIPLMQSLMDDVHIVTGEDGTVVMLTRALGTPRRLNPTRQAVAPADLQEFDEQADHSAGVALVEADREIDLSNAAELAARISSAMTNRHRALVVDLSGCAYIDSGGLAILFATAHRLSSHRQDMRLVMPEGSRVLRAVELTGLDAVAPRCLSVQEALDELSGPREPDLTA